VKLRSRVKARRIDALSLVIGWLHVLEKTIFIEESILIRLLAIVNLIQAHLAVLLVWGRRWSTILIAAWRRSSRARSREARTLMVNDSFRFRWVSQILKINMSRCLGLASYEVRWILQWSVLVIHINLASLLEVGRPFGLLVGAMNIDLPIQLIRRKHLLLLPLKHSTVWILLRRDWGI